MEYLESLIEVIANSEYTLLFVLVAVAFTFLLVVFVRTLIQLLFVASIIVLIYYFFIHGNEKDWLSEAEALFNSLSQEALNEEELHNDDNAIDSDDAPQS